MLPAAEKIVLVLEGIGDDKVRVNSSSLDHPLVILADQALEIVAIEKKTGWSRRATVPRRSGMVEAGYGPATKLKGRKARLRRPPRTPGGRRNFVINPMKEDETRLGRAPKCGARTRAGTPCQRLAIRGRRRCRLHGGLSPGAPRGAKNGNFRDGDWTAEAIEERKWLRSLVRSFAKTRTTE
jgi:hypothetical protein